MAGFSKGWFSVPNKKSHPGQVAQIQNFALRLCGTGTPACVALIIGAIHARVAQPPSAVGVAYGAKFAGFEKSVCS
jgi:hypothetical protein